jgi:hypothetical protein
VNRFKQEAMRNFNGTKKRIVVYPPRSHILNAYKRRINATTNAGLALKWVVMSSPLLTPPLNPSLYPTDTLAAGGTVLNHGIFLFSRT